MLKNPIEAVPLVGNFLGVAALVTVVLVTLVKPVSSFFLSTPTRHEGSCSFRHRLAGRALHALSRYLSAYFRTINACVFPGTLWLRKSTGRMMSKLVTVLDLYQLIMIKKKRYSPRQNASIL